MELLWRNWKELKLFQLRQTEREHNCGSACRLGGAFLSAFEMLAYNCLEATEGERWPLVKSTKAPHKKQPKGTTRNRTAACSLTRSLACVSYFFSCLFIGHFRRIVRTNGLMGEREVGSRQSSGKEGELSAVFHLGFRVPFGLCSFRVATFELREAARCLL